MKKLLGICSMIIFFVAFSGQGGSGEFMMDSLSVDAFSAGEPYYLVIPIEWSGEEPATIESMEIVEGEEPITADSGITYTFYGGSDDKTPGVYQRQDIGETKEIEGWEIYDKATVILKTTLTDVQESVERKFRIQ